MPVQVQLLNLDVRQAHAQSTVQLIGRKQISASDPPQMEGAAQRILDHLLGLPTAELRREVLPEAFQPPECGVAEEEYGSLSGRDEATTEQLSTSPLQLLQVCLTAASKVYVSHTRVWCTMTVQKLLFVAVIEIEFTSTSN